MTGTEHTLRLAVLLLATTIITPANGQENIAPMVKECVQRALRIGGDQPKDIEAYCRREVEQARQQARRIEEERTRQALKEAVQRRPENVLKNAYMNYIRVKGCYDIRQGYQMIYISDPEMAKAKQFVKEIETKLNIPNRDDVWSAAAAEATMFGDEKHSVDQFIFLYSHLVTAPCRMWFNDLQKARDDLIPTTTKKDF